MVPNLMYDDLRAGAERMYYVPFLQRQAGGEYVFAVRTAGGHEPLVLREIPPAVNAIAPNMPVLSLTTLARQIDERTTNERLLATISGYLGGLALILAGIGIYGIVAYTVARRTAELGLRIALGASGRHVLWHVARGTIAVVVTGVALGIVLALRASDMLSSILFGLPPGDPRVYVTAAGVLLITGIVARAPPVLRAFRIDPVVALRYE